MKALDAAVLGAALLLLFKIGDVFAPSKPTNTVKPSNTPAPSVGPPPGPLAEAPRSTSPITAVKRLNAPIATVQPAPTISTVVTGPGQQQKALKVVNQNTNTVVSLAAQSSAQAATAAGNTLAMNIMTNPTLTLSQQNAALQNLANQIATATNAKPGQTLFAVGVGGQFVHPAAPQVNNIPVWVEARNPTTGVGYTYSGSAPSIQAAINIVTSQGFTDILNSGTGSPPTNGPLALQGGWTVTASPTGPIYSRS